MYPRVAERRLMLESLAAVQPRAAVTEAWNIVEYAIRKNLRAQGIAARGLLVERFMKAPLTPDWIAEPVQRLRRLRASAVHTEDFEIDEEGANNYASSALKIAQQIDELTARLTGSSTEQSD